MQVPLTSLVGACSVVRMDGRTAAALMMPRGELCWRRRRLEVVRIAGRRLIERIVPRCWRIIEGLVFASRDIKPRAEVVQIVGKIYTYANCRR